jgi:hypothetical protein
LKRFDLPPERVAEVEDLVGFLRRRDEDGLLVRASSKFYENSLLLKPSLIKPIFATIEKRLILRKLGRPSQADRIAVKEALQTVIGYRV